MADELRRRRMSRHITLVLLSSLPGLAGCGGCKGNDTEEVEEVTEGEPPPSGPEQLIGGPFVIWWHGTHPTTIVRRTVPRSAVSSGTTTRTGSRSYYRPIYIGGRSGYVGGSSNAGHSSGVSRGGFGSTGHSAAGG